MLSIQYLKKQKTKKNTQTEKLKQKGKIKLFSKWENKETVEDSTMQEGLM